MPSGKETGEGRLAGLWSRIEETGAKLWEENSPAAVGLQAVIEEFKGEVSALGREAQALREQKSALEAELRRRESEGKDLAARIETLRAENAAFHERYLLEASKSDALISQKMEGYYKELKDKAQSLEAGMEERRRALEEDYRQKTSTLEAAYSRREKDLNLMQDRLVKDRSEWESKKLSEQEVLLKRDKELSLHSEQLAQEYQKKQAEIRTLKESMQNAVKDLVRDYQSKLKGASG